MTNNFSEPSTAYSISRQMSMLEIGVNILVLKELSMISNEELITLMRMIKSPDLENYTMAETIVKDLLKKVDDGQTRKT